MGGGRAKKKRKAFPTTPNKDVRSKEQETIRLINDALSKSEGLRELRQLAAVKGLVNSQLRSQCWHKLLGVSSETDDVPMSMYEEWCAAQHRDRHVVEVDVERSLWSFTQGFSDAERAVKREELARLLNAVVGYHQSLGEDAVYYYQGLHDVASVLLMVCGERAAFPLLCRLCTCHLRDCTRNRLDAVLELLERCKTAPMEEFEDGSITLSTRIKHKYLPPIPVDIVVRSGGTEQNRICVMFCQRTDGIEEGVLVSDTQGNVKFASHDMSVLLGYPVKKLAKMKLSELLPAPHNNLHTRHLKDPPVKVSPNSCRAGRVVHLLNASGVQTPVRLQVSTHEEGQSSVYVVKVRKASAQEQSHESCMTLVTGYDGVIKGVEPPGSMVFGYPGELMMGSHVSAYLDVFADWRVRAKSDDMTLIMMAMLDKEFEVPGTSWRVKVSPPADKDGQQGDTSGPSLGAKKLAISKQPPRKAALLIESSDDQGTTLVKLHLWRRDVLAGHVALSSSMQITRLDDAAARILGMPPAALRRQPLCKFLDVPTGSTWDQLMGPFKRGALKAHNAIQISNERRFLHTHPDGGTTQVVLQGVRIQEGTTSRIEVLIRDDSAFEGQKADVWVALGLGEVQGLTRGPSGHARDVAELEGKEGSEHDNSSLSSLTDKEGAEDLDIDIPAAGEDDDTQVARKGANTFVAQWVRTLSQMDDAPDPRVSPNIGSLPPISEGVEGPDKQDVAPRGRRSPAPAASRRQRRRSANSPPPISKEALALASRLPEEAPAVGAPIKHTHSEGEDPEDDGASHADSGSGAPSFVATSAAGDAEEELLVDSRRSRLLKKLIKQLTGPRLTTATNRLMWHTILVLVVMLLVHVVCFVVVLYLLKNQHQHVYEVENTALANDRSQLVTVRIKIVTYCTRPGIQRYSVCSQLADWPNQMKVVTKAIDDMEEMHTAVYLGEDTKKVRTLESQEAMDMWTKPTFNYTVYMDTEPSTSVNYTDSLWVVGNRFIAAAREMLYWMPALKPANRTWEAQDTRAHKFIMTNGPNILFQAYAKALDHLVKYAVDKLGTMKTGLIVVLIVEGAVVLVALCLYLVYLVRKVEAVRMLTLLCLVGLPGPVLRTLTSAPVKVVDDSDDDSGSESGDEEDHAGTAPGHQGQGEAAGNQPRTSTGSFAAPVVPALGAPGDPGGVGGGAGGLQHQSSGLSDADGDVGKGGDGSGPGGAALRMKLRVYREANRYHINNKTVKESPTNTLIMILPFVGWIAAVITVYTFSYSLLDAMQQPLAALNMATHVIYRFNHVRALAFLAVAADTPEETAALQQRLALQVSYLQSEYDTLMYGGQSITQEGAVFTYPMDSAAFANSEFSDYFFKFKGCTRFDQSKCYKEDSRWHEVTHNGIDVMMRRIISEMSLLALDNVTDVVYTSPRYLVMYSVGIGDLYEGLQTAAKMFVNYSIKRYDEVALIQTILLVAAALFTLAYPLLVLRPYLNRIKAEAARVAGLLSNVPQEVDVAGHVTSIVLPPKAHNFEP
mmetsp:Transcript_19977/g.43523  ORF Transcript_19977/g.43523 Transcript_19977/m.43523 type:complete len:1516 (-) Transcript_19977:1907-6454(-)